VDSNNPVYSSLDGVLFDRSQTKLLNFPAGKTGSYTVPPTVTTIGKIACIWSSLTNFTIPESVTNIGDAAFANCFRLRSVVIPNSVTNLGVGAFQQCKSLTNITIQDGVTTILAYVFCGCSSVASITIPTSVTSMGEHAYESTAPDIGVLENVRFSPQDGSRVA
jgi:hypothetical protein